jgi:hypothetical protein
MAFVSHVWYEKITSSSKFESAERYRVAFHAWKATPTAACSTSPLNT